MQRQYYQRILDKNIGTLLAGGKAKNAAGLANVTMELRKLCNHPVWYCIMLRGCQELCDISIEYPHVVFLPLSWAG